MFGKSIPNLPARDLDATAAMLARIAVNETHRHDGYSILERDEVELHYYAQADLDPATTAGMAYIRVADVTRPKHLDHLGLPRVVRPPVARLGTLRAWTCG
jgi:hypothetical protein